jgi:hypothetical protein
MRVRRGRLALAVVAVMAAAAGVAFALSRDSSPYHRPPDPFQLGIVAGTDPAEPAMAALVHAKLVRVDWDISTPAGRLAPTIAAYARRGIRVLPLATFTGRMPTLRQAQHLGAWAAMYGPGGSFWAHRRDGRLAVRDIEFGNETAYEYQYRRNSPAQYAARAVAYATRAEQAIHAIRDANPGVGLLVQADQGDTGSDAWVANVLGSERSLATEATGWTIHPYQPDWRERMDRARRQLRAHGVLRPRLYVTEWGLSTDGGRCLDDNYGWNRCMGYHQAARTLRRVVGGMRARYGDGLGVVIVYAIRDSLASGSSHKRDGYFGAFHSRGAVKGAYTRELRSLLGSSPG